MRNLVATIAAGPAVNWGHLTVPRVYQYARKCDADFQVITGPTFINGLAHPAWWKLPLIEWFSRQENYSRMLFLDADVIIPETAANIFEECGNPGIWVAADEYAPREFPQWRDWVRQHYNGAIIPDTWLYRNTGVFLIDVPAAKRLSLHAIEWPEHHTRWLEQDYLNMLMAQAGGSQVLPVKFNYRIGSMDDSLENGEFWHLYGLSPENRLAWIEGWEQRKRR